MRKGNICIGQLNYITGIYLLESLFTFQRLIQVTLFDV